MENHDLDKLRGLPIQEVAQRLGMEVNRGLALCPWHSDHTASLIFRRGRNSCHCFACGKHISNPIDLVMELRHVGFREACQWLANEYNVIMQAAATHRREGEKPAERKVREDDDEQVDVVYLKRILTPPYLSPEARHFLFDQRRILPQVVQWMGLTSITADTPTSFSRYCTRFNAPALLIPYLGVTCSLLYVQARYLGERGRKPRFQFPHGARCHIYNLPMLPHLSPGDDLYVAEGPSDTWALLSAGHKAIALPSATTTRITPSEMQLLARYLRGVTLHVYPDADRAGELFFAFLTRLSLQLDLPLVRHELAEGCKDFGEMWAGSPEGQVHRTP